MRKLLFTVIFFSIIPCAFGQESGDNLSALLGGMVESDRWIIRKDKMEEEFIGNVHYENEMYKIHADRALSERKLHQYTLEGNVAAARKDGDTLAALQAQKVTYNRIEDKGYAEAGRNKQVSLNYKALNNDYQIYGDRLDFSDKFTRYHIKGYAELSDANNAIYSDEMAFDAQTGVFEAYGNRPLFFGYNEEGDYALQADKITAQTKEGLFKAQGRVQGWVTSAKDLKELSNLNK